MPSTKSTSVDDFDDKNLQLKSETLFDGEQNAILTHYLQNLKKDSSATYKKDALQI